MSKPPKEVWVVPWHDARGDLHVSAFTRDPARFGYHEAVRYVLAEPKPRKRKKAKVKR